MTKEEIEQLAKQSNSERGIDSAVSMLEREYVLGYTTAYTQRQKDMSKISEWQLCPKCFGEGEVSNIGTSSSIYRICPVCNGNKTLIKPII